MSDISTAILNQLGGNHFLCMTGVNNLMWDSKNNRLSMRLPRNGSKANRLWITLNDNDTYTMRFFYYRAGKLKIDHKKCTAVYTDDIIKDIQIFENIYCDQLQELFTEVTKMCTYL